MKILTGEKDPILHRKAEKIKDPSAAELRKLISEMIETMHAAEGVGLAAPQIGRSIRLFVIEVGGKVSVFLNPIIVEMSDETILYEEGCLSLPGEFFHIQRSERITLDFQDLHGDKKTVTAEGFLAIVLQHEMDHLEGTLIIDRFRNQSVKKAYAL